MGSPDDPGSTGSPPPDDPATPLNFDPYRFGKPDHPIPPEYAPPGYVPPSPQPSQPAAYTPLPPYASPSGSPPSGWTAPPWGGQHGYPPPPGYPPGPYPAQPTSNGKATAALVLGIVAIVLCWLTFLDLLFVILAIVFGALGRRQADRIPGRPGRNAATAGLVCGIVAAILVGVIAAVIISKYSSCFGNGSFDQVRQCIQRQ